MNPLLRVSISASLRATNGVVVDIDENYVTLQQRGERGGKGASICIPLSDWPTINASVTNVRDAIERARVAIAEPLMDVTEEVE